MTFAQIISRIESLTNITNQRALVKDAIQWGLNDLTDRDLNYLYSETFFTTIAPYETGTITITDGSKTVTGSGTTFTAAMVNRKIRFASQTGYYRISAFVSTTELTLEAPYSGDSLSGETYSIFKDEYKLAADVDTYKILRQVEDGIALGSLEASAFDLLDPSTVGEGNARVEILSGTRRDTYSTGTVSGTVNGSTITGSSTAWTSVEGLGRGSVIVIGSSAYIVKSVDSDTQITIYDLLTVTSSGDTYEILLNNVIVQIHYIPNDERNIYYRYQRIPYPLINDQDIPDLPLKYHHLLVRYGLSILWMAKDKNEANNQRQIFEGEKRDMWRRVSNISSARIYRRKSQDTLYGINRYFQPLPPADYGNVVKL